MNVAICPGHLNLISICTGGFGLDLGVELAVPSARTVCMVEREAFAVAQLVSAMEAGHMAPAPIWSDARTFNGRAWRGAVDGLIGGIPCQPHSLAGRKGGQNDERDLWSDARRIIVQSGAWFVLIENVSGMLSAGADEIAGAERVCRDLHKLGFSVEGGLFTASEVGAPHQRERVFILAVADPDRRQQPRRTPEPREALGRRAHAKSPGSGSGDCGALVYAERSEWRPHAINRHQPNREDRGWSEAPGGAREPGQLVDDASIARSGPISIQPRRQGQASSDVDRTSFRHGGLSGFEHMAGGFNELDVEGLVRLMKREEQNRERCFFVTAPDVACSALRTIELFHHFKPLFKGWPVAFVCQDGQENLPMHWDEIDAIFIGGSTSWKCSQHAAHLIKAAKALGKWVHAGRVNTASRWKHFEKLGTNSGDGTGIGRYTHMRHAIANRNVQGDLLDAQ